MPGLPHGAIGHGKGASAETVQDSLHPKICHPEGFAHLLGIPARRCQRDGWADSRMKPSPGAWFGGEESF